MAKNKTQSQPNPWENILGPGILLLILTVIAYFPIRKAGFLNWDDIAYLTANRSVQSFDIINLFTDYCAGNWHPLTLISLAIEYKFSGLHAGNYHLTNLTFHLINSLLVFLCVKALFGKSLMAWFSAFLFALHPLHVESVAWISERKDVLYVACWLGAWYSWIRFRKTKTSYYYLICLGLFILSVFSKAMAVTWVPILFLTDYYLSVPVKKSIKESLPSILIAIIIGGIAILAQDTALKTLDQIPLYVRIITGLSSFSFYIIKSLFPYPLSPFYAYPAEGGVYLWMWGFALLTVLGVIGMIVYWKRLSSILQFGVIGYGLILLPVAQFLPVGDAFAADRYSYLPTLFLGLPLCFWIESHWKNIQTKILALLIVCILIWRTNTQVRIWQNSVSLFTHTLNLFPDYPIGQVNLGNALRDQGDYDAAQQRYFRALVTRPTEYLAWNNLGVLYNQKNDLQKSLIFYQKAVESAPKEKVNYYNLATGYFNAKEVNKAILAIDQALALDSEYPEALHLKGVVLQQLNEYKSSIVLLKQAILVLENPAKAETDLGNSYLMNGDTSQAIQQLEKVIQNYPEARGNAWHNLGYIRYYQGRPEEAIVAYQEAARQGHIGAQQYLRQIGKQW